MIPIKFSKQAVDFEHPAKGPNHCGACEYFLGGRCAIVTGIVETGDWCKKFKKENMNVKSPVELNKAESCEARCGEKKADQRSNHPDQGIKEHGLKITSRTTGRVVDVGFGPVGGGLVPKNPFASLAQAGYLHSHPEKLGAEKLAEFDAASKGKHLPKRVKK
jgi:hypothetical protein